MIHTRTRPGGTLAAGLIGAAVAAVLIAAGIYAGMQLERNSAAPENDAASSEASVSSSTATSAAASSMAPKATASSASAKNQADIDACINAATEAHGHAWADACEDRKRTMEMAYNACIEKNGDEEYCGKQWGGYADIGTQCELGIAKTAALNASYEAAKQKCSE